MLTQIISGTSDAGESQTDEKLTDIIGNKIKADTFSSLSKVFMETEVKENSQLSATKSVVNTETDMIVIEDVDNEIDKSISSMEEKFGDANLSTHIEKLESEEMATLVVSQTTIEHQIDNIMQKESEDIEASENTLDSGASVERTNIQALESEFEIKSNSDLHSEVVSTNPEHDAAHGYVDVKPIDVGTEMNIEISNVDIESKECSSSNGHDKGNSRSEDKQIANTALSMIKFDSKALIADEPLDSVTNGKPIDSDYETSYESVRSCPGNLKTDSNSESESEEPTPEDPVTDDEWLVETKYFDEIAIHVANVEEKCKDVLNEPCAGNIKHGEQATDEIVEVEKPIEAESTNIKEITEQTEIVEIAMSENTLDNTVEHELNCNVSSTYPVRVVGNMNSECVDNEINIVLNVDEHSEISNFSDESCADKLQSETNSINETAQSAAQNKVEKPIEGMLTEIATNLLDETESSTERVEENLKDISIENAVKFERDKFAVDTERTFVATKDDFAFETDATIQKIENTLVPARSIPIESNPIHTTTGKNSRDASIQTTKLEVEQLTTENTPTVRTQPQNEDEDIHAIVYDIMVGVDKLFAKNF